MPHTLTIGHFLFSIKTRHRGVGVKRIAVAQLSRIAAVENGVFCAVARHVGSFFLVLVEPKHTFKKQSEKMKIVFTGTAIAIRILTIKLLYEVHFSNLACIILRHRCK